MAENTYKIVGNDVSIGFGAASVPWGVITDISESPSATIDEYANEDGDTDTLVISNPIEKHTIKLIRKAKTGTAASLPTPKLGDVVVYLTKKWIVTKADTSKQAGKVHTMDVEITHYPALTIPESSPASLNTSEE